MSTSEMGDTVTVAEGVTIPAAVAEALRTLDTFFRGTAVAAGPLGDRSRERGAALVAGEYARRIVTAGVARVIDAADRDGDFVDDGHRAVRPWVNAHLNTSRVEALRDVQVAALGRDHPVVLELLATGAIGVAQVRQLAVVHGNPRIREAFDATVAQLLDQAIERDYDDFVDRLRAWVQLVDADGSHRDHDAAHAGRRAHIATVGTTTYLDASFGTYQGAELTEILDRFTEAEFHAEWDAAKAVHGEATCASLLPRTNVQRRADALVAIFRTAAGAGSSVVSAPTPVVDIVVPLAVFEEQLAATAEGRAARFDPAASHARGCATTTGIPIDPADAVAAALVGHVRRVIVDDRDVVIGFGRRRRLLRGVVREAAAVQFLLQTGGRCSWAGCGHRRTQCDHTEPHGAGGPTELANTGPLCGFHNRVKNQGYRTWRDADGRWHTIRPDGTPVVAC